MFAKPLNIEEYKKINDQIIHNEFEIVNGESEIQVEKQPEEVEKVCSSVAVAIFDFKNKYEQMTGKTLEMCDLRFNYREPVLKIKVVKE